MFSWRNKKNINTFGLKKHLIKSFVRVASFLKGFRVRGINFLFAKAVSLSKMAESFRCIQLPKPLKHQSQLLLSALSSSGYFKSHFCKQCGPRSNCSFRSSLIWVHTVSLYAKIGLKSLQEYSADDINRRHFQMQVFLAL